MHGSWVPEALRKLAGGATTGHEGQNNTHPGRGAGNVGVPFAFPRVAPSANEKIHKPGFKGIFNYFCLKKLVSMG